MRKDAERIREFEEVMFSKIKEKVKELYLLYHKDRVRALLEEKGIHFARGYLYKMLDMWYFEYGYIDTKTYDELLEELFVKLSEKSSFALLTKR